MKSESERKLWSFKALLWVCAFFPFLSAFFLTFGLFVFSHFVFLHLISLFDLTHKWKKGHIHISHHITSQRQSAPTASWCGWWDGDFLQIHNEKSGSVRGECDRLKWQYIIGILGPFTCLFFPFSFLRLFFFHSRSTNTICFLFPCVAAGCVCECVFFFVLPHFVSHKQREIQPHKRITHIHLKSALKWAFVDMRRQTHKHGEWNGEDGVECERMKRAGEWTNEATDHTHIYAE